MTDAAAGLVGSAALVVIWALSILFIWQVWVIPFEARVARELAARQSQHVHDLEQDDEQDDEDDQGEGPADGAFGHVTSSGSVGASVGGAVPRGWFD